MSCIFLFLSYTTHICDGVADDLITEEEFAFFSMHTVLDPMVPQLVKERNTTKIQHTRHIDLKDEGRRTCIINKVY